MFVCIVLVALFVFIMMVELIVIGIDCRIVPAVGFGELDEMLQIVVNHFVLYIVPLLCFSFAFASNLFVGFRNIVLLESARLCYVYDC